MTDDVDLSRRRFAMALPTLASLTIALSSCAKLSSESAGNKLAELETKAGGRLGVCALDVRSGDVVGHRMDERFGMCSTFRLLLAAIILREIGIPDSQKVDRTSLIFSINANHIRRQ